jgi:NADPH-dependent curcumin reductase CurA
MEGFMVSRWSSRFSESIVQLSAWIREGKIVTRETVLEGFEKMGFEKMPNAFVGLFNGWNTGKVVLKV